MENTIILNELNKERYQRFLCEAETTRWVLRSKKLDRLPRILKDLVILLLSTA
jgi:hypothetical protein